jgi:structural maintenance of chromosome 1
VAESAVEKVRAERVAIFRRCKLEDIRLPLLSGDMDDVLIDDSTTTTQQSMVNIYRYR